MSSSGSLIFYGKSGLSEPYFLGYGKTTIGSSNDNDIRIKVDDVSSCIMDTNEFGITTFVNGNVNENILVNNVSSRKYTILEDGDILEFGKIKLKYCNPSIDQKHLEQTRNIIGKKILDITTKSKIPLSASIPSKRLLQVDSSLRRFSTGSKLVEARITPKFKKNSLSLKNSSPLCAAKIRVSQRMISRRYSTLASLKENEEVDFDYHDSESPRKRTSVFTAAVTPLKNKSFSGNSKFSTPPPSENNAYAGVITDFSGNVTTSEKEKFPMDNTMVDIHDSAVSKKKASSGVKSPLTNKKKSLLENSEFSSPLYSKNNSYPGNMSELSDNITTPENNVTAASITPLNISKKTRNSLNRSSRLSYIDFPNSSTPKSAIKTNRSSVYRPLVEDITPASPLPRSLLRNSSLKKSAFTQRRSVNFDISSASDNSKSLDSDLVPEEKSVTGRKRKIPETSSDAAEVLKKIKRTSCLQLDREVHDDNSVHDSSLSGIHNMSDTSSNFSENVSHKLEIGNRSIQSFNEELPNNDISQCLTTSPLSVLSSPKRSGVQTLNKSNVRSKSLNIERTTRKSLKKFSETLDAMITNLASNESSLESSEMNGILEDLHYKSDGNHSKPKHLGRTRSKSVGCKTKSHIPSTRSKSSITNKKLSLDNSFKTAKSSLAKPSIIDTSTNIGSERIRLSTGSIKDSSLDLSDDVFEPSIKLEEGSRKSMRLSRISSSLSSSNFSRAFETDDISNYKTPKSINASSIEERYSFCSPQMRSRSISSVTSIRNSLSSSQNSSRLGDIDLGTNISITSESVFKTPKGRTPRNLKTPNNSLKKIKDPTDVLSTEKFFRKSLEDTSKRRTSTSQSAISLNESYKSNNNSSFESPSIHENHHISSAKITPQPLRMPSTRKRTPKLPYSPDGDSRNVTGVSKPMNTTKTVSSTKKDLTGVSGVEKISATPNVQNSPKNDLTDVGGVMKLFKTPKVNKSPKNDLSFVAGVKKLMKTPKIQKSPKNDLSNVEAVKKLLRTPKVQKSPYNDLTNVGGVKKLLKTPKVSKSPNNDLTNVAGMKKLLRTPKIQKSPNNDLTNINGLKKLLKTPKFQKSPKNDLTNIAGVKKLLKTPKVQKSPKNDLTTVKGVKALMNTPKIQNSPLNDLTKVAGVKKLMSTPKEQKSPKNDLTKIVGVKKLMASPKYQRTPKNDLTDVQGVNNLFKSPKEQKEPKNDLLDVRGIRQLLRTPKNKPMEESHDLSGIDILFTETEENDFDKLSGKKPIRTYGKSPKKNKDDVIGDKNDSSDNVIKWLEDQSKFQQNSVAKTAAKRGNKKFETKPQTPEENSFSSLRQRKLSKKINPELNTSSGIIRKPASTPIKSDACFPLISEVAISDITCEKNTTLERSKRNIENVEIIVQPRPKRTRRNEQKKEEAENVGNDESSETPVEKKSTRSTRRTKKVDDGNNKSSQETYFKEVEKSKDIEKDEPQKEEKIMKRTRGKKINEDINEEDAKKTENIRSRTAKPAVNESKENGKSLALDSKTKSTPEKRSRPKESYQQEDIENEPTIKRARRARNAPKEIAATTNVSEPTEMKVKRSKRGKNTKTEVEPNPKIIESESKPVEEESVGAVEKTITTRRGRKKKDEKLEDKETSIPTKKEEKNEKLNGIAGETRNTRSKKGINTKYSEEEWDSPIKIKNKKRLVTFNKSVELLQTPVEKNSTNNTRSLRPRK